MALKSGKRLGGTQPRRVGRLLQKNREPLREGHPYGVLLMFALALFVLGGVAGFGWSADREIRGGVLRQRVAAERRPDWVYIENLPRYVPEAFEVVVQPSLLTRGRVRPEGDGRTVAGELVRQVHLLPNSLAGEAHSLVMGPVLEKRISRHDLIELYLNRVQLGRAGGYPVVGIKLRDEDRLVGMVVVRREGALCTVTQNGYAKRTELSDFPVQKRGGLGTTATALNARTGALVAAKELLPGDELMVISALGRAVRLQGDDMPGQGRSTQGKQVLQIDPSDRIVEVTRVAEREERPGEGEDVEEVVDLDDGELTDQFELLSIGEGPDEI